MFCGRNDGKAETPVLWPPHVKSWLIEKDSDAGRDWGQEEKGTTEDEMAGWHHWLDGRESEWTPGVRDGQGGLACCDSWGRKESDTTERLHWTELNVGLYESHAKKSDVIQWETGAREPLSWGRSVRFRGCFGQWQWRWLEHRWRGSLPVFLALAGNSSHSPCAAISRPLSTHPEHWPPQLKAIVSIYLSQKLCNKLFTCMIRSLKFHWNVFSPE